MALPEQLLAFVLHYTSVILGRTGVWQVLDSVVILSVLLLFVYVLGGVLRLAQRLLWFIAASGLLLGLVLHAAHATNHLETLQATVQDWQRRAAP